MQRTHQIIYKFKEQKKSVLPWQQVLPCTVKKLVSSHPCRGWNAKNPQKYLYIGKRNRKKVLPWQHLLPGIVEKLVSSNLCWGLQWKEEPTKMFIYR